jgi:putative phosphoesterase
MPVNVGLISDTHGLLRPEALRLLEGSTFIIHAGDVGDSKILAELACVAPVTAVRGNIDTQPWAQALPETATLTASEAVRIYVLHNLKELTIDPVAAGFRAVISGHSHKPGVHLKSGVLYVNPGSAGPRRFSLPVSVGRLVVDSGKVSADITDISPGARLSSRAC